MTDNEIYQYLSDHNWSVKAQDGLMDILNTSYQIECSYYDSATKTMTIITSDNIFTFEWRLGNGE